MIKYSHGEMVDELDETILQILQHEGRISNVELGGRVNLSPPATAAQPRRQIVPPPVPPKIHPNDVLKRDSPSVTIKLRITNYESATDQ